MADEEKTPTVEELAGHAVDQFSDETLLKASAAASYAIQDMFAQGSRLDVPKNMKDWIGLYKEHVWAYAGIFAIAAEISGLVPMLKKRNRVTGEVEDVTDHPILRLLNRPNKSMTGGELLESLVVYKETCGLAYWEMVFDTTTTEVLGTPVAAERVMTELWPVRPDYLTPDLEKNGHGVKRWKFQTAPGKPIRWFSPDQILPFRYFHPLDPWFGLGSLQPAIDDLRQDKQMAKWNLDFFQHGITPEGIIYTDKTLTPKDMKDLGKQIKDFLVGKGRVVLILSKNLKWQTISLNPKDIEFLKGRAENRQAILAALGVPPIKVGLLEHAKYDNYFLQIEAFHKDTILPKVKSILAALNSYLVPQFPDLAPTDEYEHFLAYDTTALEREDEDKLVKRYTTLMDYGVLTPGMIAGLLGYDEPKIGKDQYYVKSNLVPVGGPETEESLEEREDVIHQRLGRLEEDVKVRLDGIEKRLLEEAKRVREDEDTET